MHSKGTRMSALPGPRAEQQELRSFSHVIMLAWKRPNMQSSYHAMRRAPGRVNQPHQASSLPEVAMHLRLLGLASLLLVQSAHAQSFDCRYARAPDEAAICEDARLSALDERLASQFFRLRGRLSGPDRARLDRHEDTWLNARHRCGGDRTCIAEAYRTRLSQLSGRSVGSAVIERTCVCDTRGNQTCAEIAR
jgi:uncharacterized protein YecT (DUF1311 family)